MPEIDYSKLTRQQKLAIFLIGIGPESSAAVLKQFTDAEIESICHDMAAYPVIPGDVLKQAMEEFTNVVAGSVQSATGGLGFVQRTLALTTGDRRATEILGRLGPGAGSSDSVIKDICEMEGDRHG